MTPRCAVAFGGDDRSILFVASARENLSDQELRSNPLSGAIFAIHTDVTARLPYVFGVNALASNDPGTADAV